MYSTLPQLVYEKSRDFPAGDIQYSKDSAGVFQPVTYADFAENMLEFGAGLLSLGETSGSHIGLISENRKEWLTASMGIMAIGASDIPRGNEATVKDLSYILSFAECSTVIIEGNYSYKKIVECRNDLKDLRQVILIDDKGVDKTDLEDNGIKVYSMSQVTDAGKDFRKEKPGEIEQLLLSGKESDTATIIFTSGTTGIPKGVALTHRNFLCQIADVNAIFPMVKGDKALCVLPVWHVYEREIEYCLISTGMSLCYSKPIPAMIMADMKKINPQFMACVPRVWDAIYKAIQKQLNATSGGRWILFKMLTGAASNVRRFYSILHGRYQYFKRRNFFVRIFSKFLYFPIFFMLPFKAWGEVVFFKKARSVFGTNFKLGMSGGGGLAPKLDRFYNSIGMRLVEGYGLTETAPMCSLRNYKKPVLGTIGRALPFCEVKVIDRNGVECKPGQLGVLWVRGPNVMSGYYKQPELTEKVLQDGWFNTGDLVIRTYKGEIMVRGRAKDTIVLRSGENVEPFPIECKLAESPYINQAVVVGQDRNCLGALVIPAKDNIVQYAKENNLACDNIQQLLKSSEIQDLIFREFERLVTAKNGFKPFEKIGKFTFLDKQFEVGVELSAKQEIVRYKINELYKWQISLMYNESVVAQNLQSLTNMTEKIISKIPGKKDK